LLVEWPIHLPRLVARCYQAGLRISQ
jgi:hypothetical protein